MGKQMTEDREFFDQVAESDVRKSTRKFYSIVQDCDDYHDSLLAPICPGAKAIEYGCGTGSYSFFMAEHGAEVTGIDISETCIKKARMRAKDRGVSGISFAMMDAEHLDFDDSTFDVVRGTAILHHLDMEKALKEIARVLRPAGRALFIEPLGHNPVINLYRKMTFQYRTSEEHPMKRQDLFLMTKLFRKTHFRYFHLFSISAVPFRNTIFFRGIVRVLRVIDRAVLNYIPGLKLLAWHVVIYLENPYKEKD